MKRVTVEPPRRSQVDLLREEIEDSIPVPRPIGLWIVQGYYGKLYGWENVCAEEERSEANKRLREYRENEPQFKHRLRFRREEDTNED
jgi:hypothetical protein